MEVCVENVESAVAAELSGAARLELCVSMTEGGLTPSVGLLRVVKSLVQVPVFVMIRPNANYTFVYKPEEITCMEMDVNSLKENGADGFVFGVLDEERNVDLANCAKLLQSAKPAPCTFHRAFDIVNEPMKAMEDIISLGFKRILTSGQKKSTAEGVVLIKDLVSSAGDRIIIMPGGGLNELNLEEVLKETGAREFHGSGQKKFSPNQLKTTESIVFDGINNYVICDEEIVRKMNDIAKRVLR